jgi:diguanylate cyclase (GGDEF)-like protein
VAETEAGYDLGEFTSSSRLLCAIITRAGRVLWANARLGRAFGPEAEAALNRPLVELLDPYDRSRAVREMTRLDAHGDEVVFVARLHPYAGGFQTSWSCHVGEDGLVYVIGVDAEPERPARRTGTHPTDQLDPLTQDHLTRTANRRTFERELEVQLDRCRQEALPLTVALVDLDHFKHYNDTYGHLAGDQCLVTLSRTLLQRTSRDGELVGRFGGDEFLVLWPRVDAVTAMRNAKSLREAVGVLDLRLEDHPVRITVSIGGITMVPTVDTTASSLVRAADRAMYAAKRKGGDAVRWVTEPVEAPEGETDSSSD